MMNNSISFDHFSFGEIGMRIKKKRIELFIISIFREDGKFLKVE